MIITDPPKKILITGCRASGRALVLALMHSFSRAPRIYLEPMSWPSIVENQEGGIWVGSESSPLCGEENAMSSIALSRLKASGVVIIHVRRGRESVLMDVSTDGYDYVYDSIEEQALDFMENIDLVLTLPSILVQPDLVQQDISDTVGLDYHTKFSAYPAMAPNALLSDPGFLWSDVSLSF